MQPSFFRFIRIIMIALAVTLLPSCNDGDYRGAPMLSVYIEDSPATDVATLFIEIGKIEISVDGTQWVDVELATSLFDITAYVGGTNLNIAKQTVPKARYKKMRITFLDNAVLNTFDATPNIALDPKTIMQTLDIDFDAQEDVQHVEMIDFDVPGSLVQIDANNYVLSPRISIIDINQGVIKAVLANKTSEESATAITKTMLVTATRDDGFVRQTYTSKFGANLFLRLPEGIYMLDIQPMSDDLENLPVKIENVEVKYYNVTNLNTIYIEKGVPEPEQ